MSNQLAVDIGGTFVDAITFDQNSGDIEIEKSSTTPDDPAVGVLRSIDGLGIDLANTVSFVHGTTLGINAFLEREGANTGIITNQNFEDVYEIARTNLPSEAMYDLDYEKPAPLVPRRRRIGVPGRIDVDGNVSEPLDEDAVVQAAKSLVEDWDVDSFAICFLHSYQNPEHEQRAGQLIRERYPERSISLSTDISREYREYERTSTAVLDAYIKPTFEKYVNDLDSQFDDMGFNGSFFISRSGGGTLSATEAKKSPVQTILSGPAGGIIGASEIGDLTGRNDLITVDIGGTSTDACVIRDGAPAIQYEASLEHLPLMIPVYDIRTIGAGGGSIAWLDGGLLKVGPKSAGASPGPICYGQGGTEPTVTDAALALGYLDPDAFLGGEMDLDAVASRDGLESTIAEPLDSSLTEAAHGILEVAVARSVGAIQEITVERGLDPRDFSMIAFGGAGPLLAPLFARELGVSEVVIPSAPAVFSAWGMLMADVTYDFTAMHMSVLSELEYSTFESKFQSLEERANDALNNEGFDEASIELQRSVEMRYFGQEHSVDVPVDDVNDINDIAEQFEAVHNSRYGHSMDDPPQVVNFRIRGIGKTEKPVSADESSDRSSDSSTESADTREAYCFDRDERVEFDVYRRDPLEPGETIEGPGIVQEPSTTIVFHSDGHAEVDEFGNLVIFPGGGRG